MSIRVQFDDLELVGFDGGGTEMFHYQGKPFTGILETVTNGIVYNEEGYINGYKEGMQRTFFYPSGNLHLEFIVKDNDYDGVFKTFDENGHIINQTTWKNGVKVT
ncbi:MAG: hypothetical protein AAGC65_24025 [Mucilaginibacter sp.]|uniref:toxin-antitoxin system YwqK family antitoxin n=1 Tax=Mucilaginibacter sp. TaxID=1882438 RepID=UPI0031A228C2